MDLTFKTDSGIFNYRVCAIIIKNNSLLAMKDENSKYYYLPGGRVKLNETAEKALNREIKEELEIDAKIERPLWFCQSFYKEDSNDEKYHELCLYYLVNVDNTSIPINEKSFTYYERNHTHYFEWISFEELSNKYLYPCFIKKEIFNLPKELKIIVDNEL